MSKCLCANGWVAAVGISSTFLGLLAMLSNTGIDVYLRERNGPTKISRKAGTRSDYRRPISDYKPLTSDHWGQP